MAAVAIGVAACGGDDDDEGGGNQVTIYSSLPLQGASRPNGDAIVKGLTLAFDQAGNKAGGVEVDYISLDDASTQTGAWTPEQESANARRAANDETAVLYIGTFNSGAAAISIPITNQAGPLAMLSPANTAVGLTSSEAGAEPGEPDKYYPTGERNYARIVPKDDIQGAALATVMDQDGCTTVGILHDKEVYGAGLARNVEIASEQFDLEIATNTGIDPKAPNYRSVAADLADQGVDCFLFSGITANNSVQVTKDIAAAIPDAKLYGPDGVAESTFYNPDEGGLPADVAARTKVTVATLDPESYGKEGLKFFEDFEEAYDEPNPNPYAIYGYEAGRLALDILKRADDATDRAAVLETLFATKDHEGILGTYSIDENGDTTLTDYGVHSIEDGQLVFEQKIEAGKAAGGGAEEE